MQVVEVVGGGTAAVRRRGVRISVIGVSEAMARAATLMS